MKSINVALVGNPNTGKTSLFNEITGLNQKVGNYPGVTVEGKTGKCSLDADTTAIIHDLPGAYSINPCSPDEAVVINTFLNESKQKPDVAVVVVDINHLKRNLFIFTQIKDLQIPVVLALNMSDTLPKNGLLIDIEKLEAELQCKCVLISSRKKMGLNELKAAISVYETIPSNPIIDVSSIDETFFEELKAKHKNQSVYRTWLKITQCNYLSGSTAEYKELYNSHEVALTQLQRTETIYRYKFINATLKKCLTTTSHLTDEKRMKLDSIVTHKVFGYVLFVGVLFVIFQAIFSFSSIPMDYIDVFFAWLSDVLKVYLPPGAFTNLIIEGVIPGIAGVVIFVPQIALLFLFISLLEEVGYMSRVVFLLDKIMRPFGLNGKSIVPLMSGTACAIPAIMATRNIENWRERLITIIITPFTTCSARLPVYAIIISIVIPTDYLFGFINLKGLVLMGLYLLGFGSAMSVAFILHKTLPKEQLQEFIIEMPDYKIPSFKNAYITVVERTKAFVFDAGKIILALSVILWVLASNGPNSFDDTHHLNTEEEIATYKLEHSYIGIMGKAIEPAITPLGYDWKIGVALIASFSAREVFVSTLATIYSVGQDNEKTLKEKMINETDSDGNPRFNLASGISLLVFYAFAMQCMSTLVIVKRETKTWKWAMYQLVGMTTIAYIGAYVSFNLLS